VYEFVRPFTNSGGRSEWAKPSAAHTLCGAAAREPCGRKERHVVSRTGKQELVWGRVSGYWNGEAVVLGYGHRDVVW
jgi:hypothetical protein